MMPVSTIAAAREVLRVKRAAKKQPTKPRKRRNGVPPIPGFDIDKLPDSALLTPYEVCGVVRKSLSAVTKWRRAWCDNPEAHPLRWVEVDGWWRCRAGDLRTFIASKPS